jgi:hypothetical protein
MSLVFIIVTPIQIMTFNAKKDFNLKANLISPSTGEVKR